MCNGNNSEINGKVSWGWCKFEIILAKPFGMKDEEFRIYKPVVSLENGLIKKDTRESF